MLPLRILTTLKNIRSDDLMIPVLSPLCHVPFKMYFEVQHSIYPGIFQFAMRFNHGTLVKLSVIPRVLPHNFKLIALNFNNY